MGRSYNEMAEFSARVAHELRTPLTLLRMRMESAAPELPPDFSEEVQEEIRRLSQLVERSLLAAKAEGGKLEAQTVPVDLAGLLEDLHEGYALLASERSLTLDWRTLPSLVVASDPELLRQILHNLIGNAIRHGREKVRVTCHPLTNRGPDRFSNRKFHRHRQLRANRHGHGIASGEVPCQRARENPVSDPSNNPRLFGAAGFASRHTESTKTMSKQTPDLGKPHSIADHEGIVAIQPKADGERVEIAFDPSRLSEQDIRHIALEHILPERGGLQRCALRLDGQACEAAAAKLERRIEKVPGVRRATATYMGACLPHVRLRAGHRSRRP